MDNRLREIEQWVAEARDDLGQSGEEAYVRKLYLLDAEIRAAIKDSGILPAADSPRPSAARVRREWMPVPALALLALTLVATTVYLRVDGDAANNSSPTILTAPSELMMAQAEPSSLSAAGVDMFLASQGEVRIEIVTLGDSQNRGTVSAGTEAGPSLLAEAERHTVNRTAEPVVASKPTMKLPTETSRSSAGIYLAGREPAPASGSVADRSPGAAVQWEESGGANAVILAGRTAGETVTSASDGANESAADDAGAKRLKKGGADGTSSPEEKAGSGTRPADNAPALNEAELEHVMLASLDKRQR